MLKGRTLTGVTVNKNVLESFIKTLTPANNPDNDFDIIDNVKFVSCKFEKFTLNAYAILFTDCEFRDCLGTEFLSLQDCDVF